MFFEARRWALRVTERMGLQAREPAATELVEMMINGAKMYKDMMHGKAGEQITQPELILMAVAAMSDNRSAFDRLKRARFDAEQLLAQARDAGRQLALENGFHETVRRFYDRLPEVSAQALSQKPTPEEALANFQHQQPAIPHKTTRLQWWLPLAVAAFFGFYHAFNRPPQAPDSVSTPPGQPKQQVSEVDPWPWRESMDAMRSNDGKNLDAERMAAFLNQPPSTVAEEPSNFSSFKLPRGVEVHIPKGWWILGSEHLRIIATTVEAAMDLSSVGLPEGQKFTLIAANSMPKTTFAAIRINSTMPPSMTRADVMSITQAEISSSKAELRQNLTKLLQIQGNQLLEVLGVRIETLAGYPVMVTEYRRTGPEGSVWVQINQVFTEQQEIGINLSYRESEAMLWKPVVAKIRQSIVVKPWR